MLRSHQDQCALLSVVFQRQGRGQRLCLKHLQAAGRMLFLQARTKLCGRRMHADSRHASQGVWRSVAGVPERLCWCGRVHAAVSYCGCALDWPMLQPSLDVCCVPCCNDACCALGRRATEQDGRGRRQRGRAATGASGHRVFVVAPWCLHGVASLPCPIVTFASGFGLAASNAGGTNAWLA